MAAKSAKAEARAIRDGTGRLLRAHPVARAIVAEWRRLSGSMRTVVACSGGADSSALLVALATAGAEIVVGHVVHDMRPRKVVLEERDRVRELAQRFHTEFRESEVTLGKGNAESQARRLRYGALCRIAEDERASFVCSGHHADDQLESILMALIRGAGPRGLRGVANARTMSRGVTLIRPMLGVTRQDAEDLCTAAGVAWAEDLSNVDVSRLRAAIRLRICPELRALRPGVSQHAARTSRLMRDAAALVAERAKQIFGEEYVWDRQRLRGESELLLGEGLRNAAMRLLGGEAADRIGARRLDAVIRAIKDDESEPRQFDWPRGIRLEVRAKHVSMSIPRS